MPLNLVDAKSGVDYFSAARQLSQMAWAGVPVQSVPTNWDIEGWPCRRGTSVALSYAAVVA
jgi:hypothetical protein